MNPQEEKEKAIWRLQKHLEIKEELRNNEVFMKFLERTHPDNRERFIDDYASEKVNWIDWGPNYKKWVEGEDLHWMVDASERLKEIQQKKLFDIQCLWRAEKLEIKQVKLTKDFEYWEDNIFNCPFIDPVSEEDVDMYIQYLEMGEFEDEQWFLDGWQDYEEIKEAYNNEDAMRNVPEWYEFHNSRTGLQVYFLLPDIRGGKEKFYMGLWAAEQRRKQKNPIPEIKENDLNEKENTSDRRPFLNYHEKGWMTWFVNTFEDKSTQELFQKFGGERNFDDYDEYLQNDMQLLTRADENIPIDGWFDWKEAVHKTADKYRRKKIIQAIPAAFEQYRINIELNIAFEEKEVNDIFDWQKWYSDAILRGRELNGEPRDFNF